MILLLIGGCAPKHYIEQRDEKVTFFYKLPEASEVIFASDLDLYKHHQMQANKEGLWSYSAPFAKEITYFYIVDGQVATPDCAESIIDDFGGKNCLYVSRM
jgi:1,4-alpha-glucan branching enzyme